MRAKEFIQKENVEDLGDGVKKITNPDGSYEISDGTGVKKYSADGRLLQTRSTRFSGLGIDTDHSTGNVTTAYDAGPLSTRQTKDKTGKPISSKAEYDVGLGVMGHEQDHISGVRATTWKDRGNNVIQHRDMVKDPAVYDRAMKQIKSS